MLVWNECHPQEKSHKKYVSCLKVHFESKDSSKKYIFGAIQVKVHPQLPRTHRWGALLGSPDPCLRRRFVQCRAVHCGETGRFLRTENEGCGSSLEIVLKGIHDIGPVLTRSRACLNLKVIQLGGSMRCIEQQPMQFGLSDWHERRFWKPPCWWSIPFQSSMEGAISASGWQLLLDARMRPEMV